jgi:hypothetical protein
MRDLDIIPCESTDEAYARGRKDGLEDAILDMQDHIKYLIKSTLDDYERRISELETDRKHWNARLRDLEAIAIAYPIPVSSSPS